jgi:hypothetical protein
MIKTEMIAMPDKHFDERDAMAVMAGILSGVLRLLGL